MTSSSSALVTHSLTDTPYPTTIVTTVEDKAYDNRVEIGSYHGTLQALAFCIVLPLGAIMIRLPIFKTWKWHKGTHRAIQVCGLFMVLLGTILGFCLRLSYKEKVLYLLPARLL